MRDPSSDTVMVPCRGCSKDLVVPKGPVIAASRSGRSFITFCSRRCERVFIAKAGQRQREANLKRKLDAGSSSSDPDQ